MIDPMSVVFIKLAQFTYIIWPLFIITAFAYSLQSTGGRNWLRTLGQRIMKNLFATWLVLFFIWLVTLFAGEPVPTLLPEPANTILFFAGFGLLMILEASKLRLVPIRILARMDMHRAQAIADLNRMHHASFEELVAETYRSLGFQARRTGQTGDHGVDIEVYTPRGERWIVQCKRYKDPVGESMVRELYGTLVSEKANRAILVTSAEITAPAEAWARGKTIGLIDGEKLLKLMEKARQKAQGSKFERFTRWLEGMLASYQTPPALKRASASPMEQTRPNRVANMQPVIAAPAIPPLCPRCHVPMVSHPERHGRGLYRCRNYPSCRVVVDPSSKSSPAR
jgi:hypothetical protein